MRLLSLAGRLGFAVTLALGALAASRWAPIDAQAPLDVRALLFGDAKEMLDDVLVALKGWAGRYRRAIGSDNTHCRTGTCGMTWSTKCAAVCDLRRDWTDAIVPRPPRQAARKRPAHLNRPAKSSRLTRRAPTRVATPTLRMRSSKRPGTVAVDGLRIHLIPPPR